VRGIFLSAEGARQCARFFFLFQSTELRNGTFHLAVAIRVILATGFFSFDDRWLPLAGFLARGLDIWVYPTGFFARDPYIAPVLQVFCV
jgi:hypothetical protein